MPAQAAADCPTDIVEPERQFSGIYVDDFEGQRFFEGADDLNDLDFRKRPNVYLEISVVGVGERFGITRRAYGLAYRLTFRGVMRSRGTVGIPSVPCGYGHHSGSEKRIDLRAVEKIELIGPVR